MIFADGGYAGKLEEFVIHGVAPPTPDAFQLVHSCLSDLTDKSVCVTFCNHEIGGVRFAKLLIQLLTVLCLPFRLGHMPGDDVIAG